MADGVTFASYGAAFGAGLISVLSPCVMPLMPAYLSLISGVSVDELREGEAEGRGDLRRRVLWGCTGFVAGFSTIFILLGASATAVGRFLLGFQVELGPITIGTPQIAGAVIIAMGLHLLGWLPIPALYRDARFHSRFAPKSVFGTYLVGAAFAFGWSPCVGPILGGILTLAGASDTVGQGMALLAVYSAGLGVPFFPRRLEHRVDVALARCDEDPLPHDRAPVGRAAHRVGVARREQPPDDPERLLRLPEPGGRDDGRLAVVSPRHRLLALLGPILLLAAVAGCSGSEDAAPQDLASAPDFTAPLLGGGDITLSELRGRPVVIDFWATWCAPCVHQVPVLNAFQERMGEDVIVIGVAVDARGVEVVAPFAEEHGIAYRVALADESLAQRYGGLRLPEPLRSGARWQHRGRSRRDRVR